MHSGEAARWRPLRRRRSATAVVATTAGRLSAAERGDGDCRLRQRDAAQGRRAVERPPAPSGLSRLNARLCLMR
eukprot:3284347-Pyramimonas_sp.AAC.2